MSEDNKNLVLRAEGRPKVFPVLDLVNVLDGIEIELKKALLAIVILVGKTTLRLLARLGPADGNSTLGK